MGQTRRLGLQKLFLREQTGERSDLSSYGQSRSFPEYLLCHIHLSTKSIDSRISICRREHHVTVYRYHESVRSMGLNRRPWSSRSIWRTSLWSHASLLRINAARAHSFTASMSQNPLLRLDVTVHVRQPWVIRASAR